MDISSYLRFILALMEVTNLDARRRLVLLRRDDVEHLVILGPASETVVEKNITAVSEEDVAAMKASFEGRRP